MSEIWIMLTLFRTSWTMLVKTLSAHLSVGSWGYRCGDNFIVGSKLGKITAGWHSRPSVIVNMESVLVVGNHRLLGTQQTIKILRP
ncbi:hypothetical protein GDO78_003913 [Eleutherodactylus coqui]|uniref:Secreted protein n=1 Tax=Eleutherodactylus coqui TaxID=57060 RepID=A0A8J6EUV2_ELECQ|nr:hypothetical protein GDO78_003913 [Eleutherodactylus coqui]